MGIQSQNVSGIEHVGQLDEAGVGEVAGCIGILQHEVADKDSTFSKTQWNLKDSIRHIRQDSLGGRGFSTAQVTSLNDNRLACDERAASPLKRCNAARMIAIASIQRSKDDVRIEQNGR
jgi:hypothetical protein